MFMAESRRNYYQRIHNICGGYIKNSHEFVTHCIQSRIIPSPYSKLGTDCREPQLPIDGDTQKN